MRNVNTHILIFAMIVMLSCESEVSNHKKLIDFAVNDTSLMKALLVDESEDIFEKKNGSIQYLVNSLVNSSAFDYSTSKCFSEIKNKEEIIDFFEKRANKIDTDFETLSTSDSADLQVFFTERVLNLQGLTIFFTDTEIEPIENIRNDPLNSVWAMNQGQFYLFKFKRGTDEIDSVCKEIVMNE